MTVFCRQAGTTFPDLPGFTGATSQEILMTPRTPLSAQDLPTHARQRCEVWTRVMGYHRPVASFNIGKQGEFQERRHFAERPAQQAAAAA